MSELESLVSYQREIVGVVYALGTENKKEFGWGWTSNGSANRKKKIVRGYKTRQEAVDGLIYYIRYGKVTK